MSTSLRKGIYGETHFETLCMSLLIGQSDTIPGCSRYLSWHIRGRYQQPAQPKLQLEALGSITVYRYVRRRNKTIVMWDCTA